LKVGDKLICKKDLIRTQGLGLDEEYDVYVFRKGSEYEVLEPFTSKKCSKKCYVLIKTDRVFEINKEYIWDWFYTDKEIRKLKLDNINEKCDNS